MNNEKDRVVNFVKSVCWTFAKTYAKTAPHEYIVREKLTRDEQELFDIFVRLINEEGHEEKFFGIPYKYFTIDDKKYWNIENIINRDDATSIYK